jgi:DNA-binding transcriptional LysR family regulator
MRATHADFGVGTYLTPAGRELLGEAQRTMCFKQLAERLDGHTAGEVYDVDAAEQERLTKLLEQDADIPIVAHEQGVFIAQGLADTVVYPPASKTTAYQLDAAGTDVTFRAYPGADHSGVMAAAFPDLLAWADDRIVNK